MNNIEHETKVAEIRQREFDARAELRRKLLEGSPTGPTRAQIAEFARSLQAEVAGSASTPKPRATSARKL